MNSDMQNTSEIIADNASVYTGYTHVSDTDDVFELVGLPSSAVDVGKKRRLSMDSSSSAVEDRAKKISIEGDRRQDAGEEEDDLLSSDDEEEQPDDLEDDTPLAIRAGALTIGAKNKGDSYVCSRLPMNRVFPCYDVDCVYRDRFDACIAAIDGYSAVINGSDKGNDRPGSSLLPPLLFNNGDSFVGRFISAAVKHNRESGKLSTLDVACVLLYHDAFGCLDAYGMFEALKRVPLKELAENLDFTLQCVRYIVRQYATVTGKRVASKNSPVTVSEKIHESVRRMAYYQEYACAGKTVSDWSNRDCIFHCEGQTLEARMYARSAPPVLLDAVGEKIFQLLQDNAKFDDDVSAIWSELGSNYADRLFEHWPRVASVNFGEHPIPRDSRYLVLGDCCVRDFIRVFVDYAARENGLLSMKDIVAIYRYHERFDNLCAFDLFECLKLVPISAIMEHQLFFVECVRYVVDVYRTEIEAGDSDRSHCTHDKTLHAALASLAATGVRTPAVDEFLVNKAPLFVDCRWRRIFRCFSRELFLLQIAPLFFGLPVWSLGSARSANDRTAAIRKHATVSALVLATDWVARHCDLDCWKNIDHVWGDSYSGALLQLYNRLMERGCTVAAIPFSHCVSRHDVALACEQTRGIYYDAIRAAATKEHRDSIRALDHQRAVRGAIRLHGRCPIKTHLQIERLGYYHQLNQTIDQYTHRSQFNIRSEDELPPCGYVYATVHEFMQS